MSLLNLAILLMGVAFQFEGTSVLLHAPTITQQLYGALFFGSGGIILALSGVIQAIQFPRK